ncbi:MAG: hypothetical protein FWH03_08940 [Firmicutes bacterium]|nr:hypothetical protein [Bacillota bacterium]
MKARSNAQKTPKRITAVLLIAILTLAVCVPLLSIKARTAHADTTPPVSPTGTFNLATGTWNAGGG